MVTIINLIGISSTSTFAASRVTKAYILISEVRNGLACDRLSHFLSYFRLLISPEFWYNRYH